MLPPNRFGFSYLKILLHYTERRNNIFLGRLGCFVRRERRTGARGGSSGWRRPCCGVFLVGDDGKGTVRLMAGFRTNKSPGAGGKVAMKAERLLCAHTVAAGQDALIISALGKIIRFAADDIPAKVGVVQGVHCMSLRADSVTAATVTDAGAPIAEEV